MNFEQNFMPRSARDQPAAPVEMASPMDAPPRFDISPEPTPDERLTMMLRKLLDEL